MTVHGMNRWKSAKASDFTTDGSGQLRPTGGDADGPIKKVLPAGQMPEDDTMAMSPIMRPKGGDADGPIKKSLRVRGSQRLQAVRPDESPGPDHSDENDHLDVRALPEQGQPRRRRRRRTTRAAGRSSSTP